MTALDTSAAELRGIGPIDRCAHERMETDLLERLRAEPATRVIVVRADETPLGMDDGLELASVAAVPDDAEWAFLGRDPGGRPVLVASIDGDTVPGHSGRWGALRTIGGALPVADSAALVTAVSLGRWLRDAAFCPACGSRTQVATAGWSRTCPSCGREHFPRTDPAVIVAVTREGDPDRLLLGANALWGGDRYSCFAGFAEAGESVEDTVMREVQEEAGVAVASLRYIASQGWPYPRSLMLGFRAEVPADAVAEADGEEIVEVRWFTREEIREGLRGAASFQLPGPSSIAHRLITQWLAEAP